jgi:Domain of unknown function (DUF4326)
MAMDSRPRRLQRRRTGGFRKPAGAVIVDRTSSWGNPFEVGRPAEPLTPPSTRVVAETPTARLRASVRRLVGWYRMVTSDNVAH